MEFERALYRIYDRTVHHDSLLLCTKVTAYISISCGLVTLLVLVACHLAYVDVGTHLAEAISHQLLDDCTNYTSAEFNLTLPLSQDGKGYTGAKLFKEDLYGLRVISDSGWFCSFNETYEFTLSPHVLLLPGDIWDRKQFARYNLTIRAKDLMPFLYCPVIEWTGELDTIILNQLAVVFAEEEGIMRNVNTEELWSWRKREIAGYQEERFNVLWAVLKLIRGLFLFFIVSSISALVCRLAIIGSAGLIMSLDSCLRLFNASHAPRMMLYYSFPWIGQPAYALQQSGRSPTPVISSFVYMLLTLYFMYACCYLMWTPMIFGHVFPKGIDDDFYTFVSFVEFFSLIYVRTKESVVFFPRVTGLFILVFFMYRFNHFYGFLNLAFKAMVFLTIAAVALTLRLYESKAIDPLLPNSDDSLSSDNVRQVYHAVFSRSTGGELPELWSLFYPVSTRDQFTEAELQRGR